MKLLIFSGILTALAVILQTKVEQLNPTVMNATLVESTVLEIAMFRIKDSEVTNFGELNKRTLRIVSNLPGYIRSSTYQSISDSMVFMDIVEWESLDAAGAAAELFENDDRFKEYLNTIEEVKYFDHNQVLPQRDYGILKYRDQSHGDILEFTSFYLREDRMDDFVVDRMRLMDHLGRTYEGFKGVSTIHSLKDPEHLIDLGIWQNAAVCETAQKDLESHELFAEFASSLDMEKEVMMKFFVKIR